MPAGGIHLCVAKKVATLLNIDISMNYLVGSIAPDSWRNSNSTKLGTHFLEEEGSLDYNYDYFYSKYKDYLSNDFVLGYLVHLITDRYWRVNNFITTTKPKIYEEEIKACSNIISRYNIQRLYLPSDLDNVVEELETSGIEKTINYLNGVNYLEDKNSVYDVNEILMRIKETAEFVSSELDRLKINKLKR